MKRLFAVRLFIFIFSISGAAMGSTASLAAKLFNTLACGSWKKGTPDPRPQMEALIAQGKLAEAAKLATASKGFANCVLRRFFIPWTTKEKDPFAPLNDMAAMMIGKARDELPFNEVLYKNDYYGFPAELVYTGARQVGITDLDDGIVPLPQFNYHFYLGDLHSLDLSDPQVLKPGNQLLPPTLSIPIYAPITPQVDPSTLNKSSRTYFYSLYLRPERTLNDPLQTVRAADNRARIPEEETSGVLTSRAWLSAHTVAGTNRRAVEKSFEIFLCKPIQEMRDKTLSDHRVRRDVDRTPGGTSITYLNQCRSCHAGLDGLAGAFARLDFLDMERFVAVGPFTNPKIFRAQSNYPEGFLPKDDTYENLWTEGRFASLGWNGFTEGRGVNDFGKMLAHSRAFPVCMAKRVLEKVCPTSPELTNLNSIVEGLADGFIGSNYNMKRLFEAAAILPECLGR
jgi:hypothetical protein